MDFIPFSFIDFIDILLVALFMFGIYRMSRGTNAPYIFRQQQIQKLFKIYLSHSFMLFTALPSSNFRCIATAIRLKLKDAIATK